MNAQRNKVIFLVVVLLVGGFVIYRQFQPSEQEKQAMANAAKNPPAQAAGTSDATAPAAAATPGGQPAGAPPAPGGAAPPASAQSRFQTADVNVAELLKTVREVTFDYDAERAQRDPLRPLVGPMALAAVRGAKEGEAPPTRRQAEALARSMRLTGIVWDSTHPLAVINDEVVSQGYVFEGGITVETIESDRVILRISEGDSPESLIPIELEGAEP